MKPVAYLSLLTFALACFPSGFLLAQDQDVQSLIADLNKQGRERLQAIKSLADLGPKASPAVPKLFKFFSESDEDLRLNAAIALGRIGKASVKTLTKGLSSDDADVRFYSVWALSWVGPPGKGAAPSVVKLLADENAEVRRKAAYTLGRIAPEPKAVVQHLIKALADKETAVSQAAANSLPKFGKAAVPALVKALKKDGPSKKYAAQSLGKIGAEAKEAIPDLKEMLFKSDPDISRIAANTLAKIGRDSIPVLMTAAKSDNQTMRSQAVLALQQIGVPAVPHIVDLLDKKYAVDVRRQAAQLLGGMQVNDKMVVLGLAYALKDKDNQVRQRALNSIQRLGRGAKMAGPYVAELLVDIDPNIRRTAFYTLRGLGSDPRPGLKKALAHKDAKIRINTASLMVSLNMETDLAIPVLVKGLKHDDLGLRMQAASTLARRGKRSDDVLPVLIAGLKHKKQSVRLQAVQAIGLFGPKAEAATQDLIDITDDGDFQIRLQALRTLQKIQGNPKLVLPAVIRLMGDKNQIIRQEASAVFLRTGEDGIPQLVQLFKANKSPEIRMAAVQTLAQFGPAAKEAIPELISALEDSNPVIRWTSARALGNIGPEAKKALPALEKLTEHANTVVRSNAKLAVAQIKGKQENPIQINGVLSKGDPFDRVRDRRYSVVYVIKMRAGETYTISLNSNWDPYLRLENSQGRQLAYNDDGGRGLNSLMRFRPPEDGFYRVIVTSYGQGRHGPFTLRIHH